MDVGIACARSEGTLELTAQKGFMPLMTWTATPTQLREMIEIYLGAGVEAPVAATRQRVRIARVVHVADSVADAKRQLHGADLGGALTGGRLDQYLPPGGTRADLTMEYLIDQGVFICGDPDTVYGEAQYGDLVRFDRKTGESVGIRPYPKADEAPVLTRGSDSGPAT